MKKYIRYRPRVRSKNYSCNELRHKTTSLGFYPFRSLIRLGSLTPTEKVFPNHNNIVEINSVQSIVKSRSKLQMKEAFAIVGVPQANWLRIITEHNGENIVFEDKDETIHSLNALLNYINLPILAKKIYGFKSKGMIKLNSQEELEEFIKNTNLNGYYIEQFHNYFREYRLHVTKDGCFYGLRKMIKEDTPEDKRWFRNDSNCIWILEENLSFDKPVNWDKIEKDCVKALEAVELDIGCFDVKVQSSTTPNGEKRLEPLYILIEVNSAPSMGEITIKKYKKAIPKLLMKKYETLLS